MGIKKGEKRPWSTWEKKGRTRNVSMTFKFTEEEREYINNLLSSRKGTKTDVLLKLLGYEKA